MFTQAGRFLLLELMRSVCAGAGDKEGHECVSDTLRFVVGDEARLKKPAHLRPSALAASTKRGRTLPSRRHRGLRRKQ